MATIRIATAVGVMWTLLVSSAAFADAPDYGGAYGADPDVEPVHSPFVNADGDLFEWHGALYELDDSTLAWHKGQRAGHGGCTFQVPELELPDGAGSIAQRQVATNYTTCEVLVETGTPVPDSEPKDPPKSEISSELVLVGKSSPLTEGASNSAYYRIWWEDVVNLWVTKTTASIWWGYDWSKVEWSNGSYLREWRSGTGWLKHSSSEWSTKISTVHKYYTDVTFKNGAFCWPGTVWNYYDNQYVAGSYVGARSGGYAGTWTTYPFACPTLHFHTQLGVA